MLEIFGAIFIIVVGSAAHFLYDWTKHNKKVGFFTAVNESTWEHLKLLIAPSLLWLIVEYHFYYDNPNLFFAKFISLLVMISIVPIIFYSYTHFTKKPILAVDILSFVIAASVGQFLFHVLIGLQVESLIITHIGAIGMILFVVMYLTQTYAPDKDFLHKDPITKRYGIRGHSDHEHGGKHGHDKNKHSH